MYRLKPIALAITVSGCALYASACSSQQYQSQPEAEKDPLVLQQETPEPTLAAETLQPDSLDLEQDKIAESSNITETQLVDAQSEIQQKEELQRPSELNLKFGFDRQELAPDQLVVLEQHGEFLAENPHIKVTINGHADSQGDARYNEQLALKRAAYAAGVLQQKGVQPEQIEVKSWGASIPTSADASHPQNRRIELEYGAEFWVSNDE